MQVLKENEVRLIAGSRGFIPKQMPDTFLCHGGIEELDFNLKNGLQNPPPINVICCRNGLEIITGLLGKKVFSALKSNDIISIKYSHVINGKESHTSIGTGAIVGAVIAGPAGALAGATAGMMGTLSRICYAIEYKTDANNTKSLFISFLPIDKKKVDRFFLKNFPAVFDGTYPI